MFVRLHKVKTFAYLTKHYDNESSDIQEIYIDLSLELINKNPASLKETIDYVLLEEEIVKLCNQKQFAIIEELANFIADALLAKYPILNVDVAIEKFEALKHARSESVLVKKSQQKHFVALSLGSNINDRFAHIKNGVSQLETVINVVNISSVYESDALLLPNSPQAWNKPFYNICLTGYTKLSPESLLTTCQDFESKRNNEKWSPRELDIDILLFDNLVIKTESLILPHSEMMKRDFVLIPLSEIYSNVTCSNKNNIKKVYDKSIWNN